MPKAAQNRSWLWPYANNACKRVVNDTYRRQACRPTAGVLAAVTRRLPKRCPTVKKCPCVFVDADYLFPSLQADVAELADALDSKSGSRKGVWVRPPPSAKRCSLEDNPVERAIDAQARTPWQLIPQASLTVDDALALSFSRTDSIRSTFSGGQILDCCKELLIGIPFILPVDS